MKEVTYESYKEERDLILEYNQVDLDNIKLVNIAGLGVHNVTTTEAVAKVIRMIESGGVHHIIPVNPDKMGRMKLNSDLRLIGHKADMLLNSGAGIDWAARMMKQPLKERIPLLSFLMELVRISEIKEYTIFLVGGKPEVAERAFFNIRKSFPKIRIVGRHGGYFNTTREKSVVEAMRKSQANIIFVGLGSPKEDKWINKIRSEFNNTVFISAEGSIDIISGEKRKAPAYFVARGLTWYYRIVTRPWRWLRLLRVFFFFLNVIFKRIFK